MRNHNWCHHLSVYPLILLQEVSNMDRVDYEQLTEHNTRNRGYRKYEAAYLSYSYCSVGGEIYFCFYGQGESLNNFSLWLRIWHCFYSWLIGKNSRPALSLWLAYLLRNTCHVLIIQRGTHNNYAIPDKWKFSSNAEQTLL